MDQSATQEKLVIPVRLPEEYVRQIDDQLNRDKGETRSAWIRWTVIQALRKRGRR